MVLTALEYVGCEGQVEDEREGYEVDEGAGEETFHEVVLKGVVVGREVE